MGKRVNLKETNSIETAEIPFFKNAQMCLLSNYLLYEPYKNYETAKEMVDDLIIGDAFILKS